MPSKSYHFRVGSFECYALSDGRFSYPLEVFFASAPREEVQAALQERGLPPGQITTPYTLLLVDTGSHRVLVDTGAGNMGAHASQMFPTVDHSTTVTGTLVESLQSAGFQPGDIDTVIITHAHPDHVAGTLDARGALVFPNAAYFIHLDEWAFWNSQTAFEKAPATMVEIARRSLEPLEPKLTRFEGEAEIVPGIRALPTPGHTPGHLAVSIRSDGGELLHIADVVLTPLHLEHPAWFPVFDTDPVQAAASKRRICDQAAAVRTMIFAHHFSPFPSLGYISRRGEAWQWQPLEEAG